GVRRYRRFRRRLARPRNPDPDACGGRLRRRTASERRWSLQNGRRDRSRAIRLEALAWQDAGGPEESHGTSPMIKNLNWQAPRMDALSQKEAAEMNARDHFTLRLKWARAVSEVLGIPLSQALFEYTDVALRMGFANLQDPGEQWNSF